MARLEESLLAAWVRAAPTDVGRPEAMLAKMRIEVPLPSLSSEMVSAICSNQQLLDGNDVQEMRQP